MNREGLIILAENINLSKKQISKWFYNRRKNIKKEQNKIYRSSSDSTSSSVRIIQGSTDSLVPGPEQLGIANILYESQFYQESYNEEPFEILYPQNQPNVQHNIDVYPFFRDIETVGSPANFELVPNYS